jgi:hypothetical protein
VHTTLAYTWPLLSLFWKFLILIVPFVGALIYVVARPADAQLAP